jgi:myo-inositol-1(or 4)-monophosphatase
VREAGGFATDAGDADPRETGNVVAGNPHLHAKLRTAVIEGMTPPPAS